jgi:putative ABC transport system ATP-binding protein
MTTTGDHSPVLELRDVTKEYSSDGQRIVAARDVTLRGERRKLILLLGPSGSGKTTLLTLAAGLIQPTCGEVYLFGKDLKSYAARELQELRARRIGFIFQNFLLIDSLTVEENVEMVLDFAGRDDRNGSSTALELLGFFGVSKLARKFPSTISQGEKQRVAIARAVANDADLILADEPTASLDTKQGLHIIQLLHILAAEQNRCVIVASHDPRLVEFADVVVHLQDGEIQQ